MSVIILDTETTGTKKPQAIEIAYQILTGDSDVDLRVSSTYSERFNPGEPSTLSALATHHILDSDLDDKPQPDTFILPDDTQYIIGHNIDYDWSVIGEPDVKRICTLALARNVLPTLESHKLTALAYHFMGAEARPLAMAAHGALADCELVRHVLRHLVPFYKVAGEPFNWEVLWCASTFARYPRVLSFGKHKGTAIKDLPRDYVDWLLKQTDLDEYLKKALENVHNLPR